MGIKVLKRLLALWLSSMVVVPPVAAEDLLADDLLAQEFDDGADLFADEGLSAQSIIVAQNKPVQLSIEHTLAVNPKANFQRNNHTTDLRLSSETSLGLLGYAQVEVKAIQYWPGDLKKPLTGHFSLLEVEQLMLQYSLAETSVKLGSYILSWGEVEGAGVLDVINPAPDLTTGATAFTPQWLLSASYYMPAVQVSAFVGLDPSVAVMPSAVLSTNVAKEWGMKYHHSGSGSDWAIYAGHMVPNSAVVNLATATASAKAYQLIGYSWNRVIGDDLVKFDLAYKKGLEHNLGFTSLILTNRLDAAFGLELNDGDRQWNAAIMAQHWLNYQSSYLTPALPPLVSGQTHVRYSLGVDDSFDNNEFSWSLIHIGTPNGSLRGLTAQVTWQPTDHWQSSLGYAAMTAKGNTAYALLDGTQLLTFKAKFSY